MGRFQRTVLIVEDDEDHALLLRLAFQQAAVECTTRVVTDGEAALAYLMALAPYDDRALHPWPSLVLLDLGLPKRSGFDVLRWIGENRGEIERLRELPVVVLTSSADPAEEERARELGARDFHVKPAGFGRLVETIRSVVEEWLPGREDEAAGGAGSAP